MLLCAALFTIHCSLFTSCKQEDDQIVYQQQHHWVEKTVAVVAPLGNAATKARLEQTAGWFLDNFHEAQLRDTLCIRLKLEWYDEQSENMATLGTTLAGRDDILAVIGPFDNNNVALFAPACKQTLKPLIAPTATSEDVIRRYAVTSNSGLRKEKPFLWSLTESDVAFSEMLMSHFATYVKYFAMEDETPEAALFTPDDVYGKTFFDWLPFQAENFDIKVPCNQQFSGSADLKQRLRDYLTSLHSRSSVSMTHVNTFCVVESAQELYDVALMRRQWMLSDPELKTMFPSADPFDPANAERWQLFENTFRTWFALSNISEEDIDALGAQGAGMLQGYQGFSPYADPSTGFELSYTKKFRQQPTFAECKLYDALLLVGFAASYAEHYQKADADKTLNDAIIAVSSVQSGDGIQSGAAWSVSAMEQYLKALEQGRLFHLIGASGEIAFDSESYTAATATTYLHWQVLEGQLVHQAYYGAGGTHVASASAAWKYLYDEQQALADWDEMADDQATGIQYPDLTAQYAVLVQGSDGLKNYRHQADVLSMYQLLRKNGFTDDQIILVIDGATAQDKGNPEKGIVRTSMTGQDLLGGTDGLPKAVVDYDAATLSATDIADILLGRQSSRLPVVLPHKVGQNVFFYWSGHGRSTEHGGSDEFEWRDAPIGQGFTADLLRQTANEMLTQGYCSKMLVVAEPCYGEAVIRPLEGIQGVLAISGASATEQSWSDNWRDPGLFWMCDRFSQNFVNGFAANPDINYRDLYLYCSQHTLGSHVKIVNAAHFGNLYTTGPQEFLVKDTE
jgi:glycosylphosphatidylinositol transamidase (GPIT) subunit GPI8